MFDLGYKKNLKNKTEIVYSLSFGEGDYLCPQKAISSYYNEGALNLKETSINKDSAKGTSYSAYCRFVANESTILLGTNRDVERMNKRLVQGKVEDVVFEPLTKFTDLVQFVFLAKGENAQKNICKQKFVDVLTGVDFQEKVVESGLYSVAKTGVMQDIPFEIIEDYDVFNVFITKNEIEKLREKLF